MTLRLLLVAGIFFFSQLPLFSQTPQPTPGSGRQVRLLWSGPETAKKVALTFDDGPRPGKTERLLSILDQHQVKATFFVVGKQAVEYPRIMQKIEQLGHEVGNHTYNHARLKGKNAKFQTKEIDDAQKALKKILKKEPIFYRPPFGELDLTTMSLLSSLKLTAVYWSIDTRDWEGENVSAIQSTILSELSPGAVILMHDHGKHTAEALQKVIPAVKKQGYTFETLTGLFAPVAKPTPALAAAQPTEEFTSEEQPQGGHAAATGGSANNAIRLALIGSPGMDVASDLTDSVEKIPTLTSLPTVTNTPVPTVTAQPTASHTASPEPTFSPTRTRTATPEPSSTSSPTHTATTPATLTPIPTRTALPTSTRKPTLPPPPTSTRTPLPSPTPTATATTAAKPLIARPALPVASRPALPPPTVGRSTVLSPQKPRVRRLQAVREFTHELDLKPVSTHPAPQR